MGAYDGDPSSSHAQLTGLLLYSSAPEGHHDDDEIMKCVDNGNYCDRFDGNYYDRFDDENYCDRFDELPLLIK